MKMMSSTSIADLWKPPCACHQILLLFIFFFFFCMTCWILFPEEPSKACVEKSPSFWSLHQLRFLNPNMKEISPDSFPQDKSKIHLLVLSHYALSLVCFSRLPQLIPFLTLAVSAKPWNCNLII